MASVGSLSQEATAHCSFALLVFIPSCTGAAAAAEHQPPGLAGLLSWMLTSAPWAYTCPAHLCLHCWSTVCFMPRLDHFAPSGLSASTHHSIPIVLGFTPCWRLSMSGDTCTSSPRGLALWSSRSESFVAAPKAHPHHCHCQHWVFGSYCVVPIHVMCFQSGDWAK